MTPVFTSLEDQATTKALQSLVSYTTVDLVDLHEGCQNQQRWQQGTKCYPACDSLEFCPSTTRGLCCADQMRLLSQRRSAQDIHKIVRKGVLRLVVCHKWRKIGVTTIMYMQQIEWTYCISKSIVYVCDICSHCSGDDVLLIVVVVFTIAVIVVVV